jgi:hypothetical protein
MTRRLLISVGCNNYDHYQPLHGAETDGERVFNALIKPNVGEYDLSASTLLLSPTLRGVQDALTKTLFSGGPIDTFTFFFAGHGEVKAGSFYMCLCDTRADALSATALSLSELFLKISEARPSQSNIIIDACEGGGLISDLGVILKSELLGNFGTPGITLLATSARDQYSTETSKGGVGTGALLGCILGTTFIQDITATLDLVEIGRKLSQEMAANPKQTPVVWGLNLYGPPRFCKNPYFHSQSSASLRHVLSAWPPLSDAPVEEHLATLWDVYLSVDRNWNAETFREKLEPVLEGLAASSLNLITFMERFSSALVVRGKTSVDPFRASELLGACFALLLPYCGDGGVVDKYIHRLTLEIIDQTLNATNSTVTALRANRFALLGGRGGLSDLFYLPYRISKILGWSGTAVYLSQILGIAKHGIEKVFIELLDLIICHYSTAVTAMTDAQAPFLAIALVTIKKLGAMEQGETLTSLMFSSLLECKAKVARRNIEAYKVFQYLRLRSLGELAKEPSLIAQPSELLMVTLKSSSLFELQDTFDEEMYELDHVFCFAYIPDDYSKFGREIMTGGENATYLIGHDVWSTSELEAAWPPNARIAPTNRGIYCGAIFASLLFPDRVTWFIFDKAADADAGTENLQ